MRRIGYYLDSATFGGGERYLLALLRRLDRDEAQPQVYFRCTDPDGDRVVREELRRLGVAIVELDDDG